MISVCMATFNGEKYISEQIDSIIKQLPADSELVISDDGSKDNTISIIESFEDSRIKLLHGPEKGVVKNFENAINSASGDIIFLSDQDDIWVDNKVAVILDKFKDPGVKCVLHDAVVTDAGGNTIMPSLSDWRGLRHGVLNNIIKNSYTGCCMAFKKDFIDICLPFPDNIPMHDWWIGLCAERAKVSLFATEKLIKYRRHGNNANSIDGYPLKIKISNRLKLIKALL